MRKNQRQVLNRWCGAARYVYNKALAHHKSTNAKYFNVKKMRDMFVTKDTKIIQGDYDIKKQLHKIKDATERKAKAKEIQETIKAARATRKSTINPNIEEWEAEIPKAIRDGAIRDLNSAIQGNLTKQENGQIKTYDMKFKTKRKDSDSIEIPSSAITVESTGIRIYPTVLTSLLKCGSRTTKKWIRSGRLDKEWNRSYVRLVKRNNRYWLLFPIEKHRVPYSIEVNSKAAIDQGLKNFATCFSEKETAKTLTDKDGINCLRARISSLQSQRARYSTPSTKNKKDPLYDKWTYHIKRLNKRITNIIDDLHWKTITYLTRSFDKIVLPVFETQKMSGSSKLPKRVRSWCNTWYKIFSHYRFRMRLTEKCEEKYTELFIVTEEYTSQTCGICGELNKCLRGSRVYNCSRCYQKYDRDINGARNILIKHLYRCPV